jgi:hypothetical protein
VSVDRGHYSMVAGAILDGKVVPVLGAGANLCDREENEMWKRGVTLPSGAELAEAMGTRIGTTEKDEDGRTIKAEYDLIRVSQAVLLGLGEPNLYAMLRKVFVRGAEHNVYEPTSLHRFLAGLPDLRVRRGLPPAPLLIVSTNYDDLLEQAFTDAGKPFDLVYYLAQGDPAPVGEAALEPAHEGEAREPAVRTASDVRRHLGRFVHVDADGNRVVITNPKKYEAFKRSENRIVILKIHGTAREKPHEDSWVITEDHYIEYLTRTNINELFPVHLLNTLLYSHLLFLGYAMRDWNLRVILHRILKQRGKGPESWAIQKVADELEKTLWRERDVNIQEVALKPYVEKLAQCLDTMEDF